MSIKTYHTPEVLALLDEIGWPTWGNGRVSQRLCNAAGQWAKVVSPVSDPIVVCDHIALCLLRNHFREYIPTYRYSVTSKADTAGLVCHFGNDQHGGVLCAGGDLDSILLTMAEHVLAEVKAVLAKGHAK